MTVCKYKNDSMFVRAGDAYVAIEPISTLANCAAMDSEGRDGVYCQGFSDVRKFNFTTMQDDYVLRPAHRGNYTDEISHFMFVRVAPDVVWLMGGTCGKNRPISGVTVCNGSVCVDRPDLEMPRAVSGGAAAMFRGIIYITGGYSGWPTGNTLLQHTWFAYDLGAKAYTPIWETGNTGSAYHRVVVIDGVVCLVGGIGHCEIEKLAMGHGRHTSALLCSAPQVRVDYIGML